MSTEINSWLSSFKKDLFMQLGFDIFVGAVLLFGDPRRTQSQAFDAPKQIIEQMIPLTFYPMRFWGGVLLLLAIALLFSFFIGHQTLYTVTRYTLCSYWGFWAGIFLVSFFVGGRISPFGPGWGVLWAYRTIRMPQDSPFMKLRTRFHTG